MDLVVYTGFTTDLDRLTSGWQPVTLLAARPGMGKTAFTLSMAQYCCGF
jgi:replicative DNA helicase